MDEDLHFPFAGIDVSQAVGRQPNQPGPDGKYSRTTIKGVNVRAYDTGGRARGGSRAGIEKYVETRPGDTEYVTQYLGVLVTTGDSPVQPSQSGRKVMLVAVSQGTVYFLRAGETSWNTPTNNTGETPALNITGLVRGAAYADKLYFVDGTNYCYFDGTTETVETWVASAGDLPVDSDNNTARLICLWRGRIILSGVLLNPNQLFAAKVGDPTNFDYAPPTPVPADSAWSSSTGPQGNLGDVINGLVPYTDNLLVIGMDARMAIFRGDPMAGGSIDNVTTTIGMAWGEAWCMDPTGIVYFFSNRTGVFRFIPGQIPQRMSTPIDSLLLTINTGEYGILLQWEDRPKILHIWITLLAEQFDTVHYEWESQANAWWQRVHGNTAHNPLACVNFDGNDADDRVSLIGGWDGYVRALSFTATDDDGTAIDSEVWIGSFLTKYNDSVLVKEVQGVLAQNSGDVQYAIYVADTAEEALDSTPATTGTWADGRNYNDMVRRAGYGAYVQITSAVRWAMESIRAVLDIQGTTRRRAK